MIVRWTKIRTASAFSGWLSWLHNRKGKQKLLKKAIQRAQSKLLFKSWSRWKSHVLYMIEVRATLESRDMRWKNAELARAFTSRSETVSKCKVGQMFPWANGNKHA